MERLSIENLPVAMFPGATFDTGQIALEPGDIIAIATDGIPEISNRRDEELGCGYVEQALTESASRPLSEIVEQIVGRAEEFGKVTDDRTMLLLRYG